MNDLALGSLGELRVLSDLHLLDGLRGWRYKPYVMSKQIAGRSVVRPVPVCGMVTFIYAMQSL